MRCLTSCNTFPFARAYDKALLRTIQYSVPKTSTPLRIQFIGMAQNTICHREGEIPKISMLFQSHVFVSYRKEIQKLRNSPDIFAHSSATPVDESVPFVRQLSVILSWCVHCIYVISASQVDVFAGCTFSINVTALPSVNIKFHLSCSSSQLPNSCT